MSSQFSSLSLYIVVDYPPSSSSEEEEEEEGEEEGEGEGEGKGEGRDEELGQGSQTGYVNWQEVSLFINSSLDCMAGVSPSSIAV